MQVEDLRLDRDVERRDGLVGDDQLRRERQARARCRAAGAGRRRTRAGSARAMSGATARPASAARRRGRGFAARRRCHARRIGSAIAAPTGWRGLRLAYGSWKIICICAAQRAQLALVESAHVAALEPRPCRRSARPGAGSSARSSTCRSRFADQRERLAGAAARTRRSRPRGRGRSRGRNRPA